MKLLEMDVVSMLLSVCGVYEGRGIHSNSQDGMADGLFGSKYVDSSILWTASALILNVGLLPKTA